MVFDNIEATFEFDPCTRLSCDHKASCTGCDRTRQHYEMAILGPIPI